MSDKDQYTKDVNKGCELQPRCLDCQLPKCKDEMSPSEVAKALDDLEKANSNQERITVTGKYVSKHFYYTDEDRKYIIENRGKIPIRKIAEHLNRDIRALEGYILKMKRQGLIPGIVNTIPGKTEKKDAPTIQKLKTSATRDRKVKKWRPENWTCPFHAGAGHTHAFEAGADHMLETIRSEWMKFSGSAPGEWSLKEISYEFTKKMLAEILV
jgi:hypothetical protein